MGLGGMATGVGAVMLGMYWARDDAQLWGSATSIALMIVAGYMGLWVAVTLLGALCWCLSRPFLALQSRFGANRTFALRVGRGLFGTPHPQRLLQAIPRTPVTITPWRQLLPGKLPKRVDNRARTAPAATSRAPQSAAAST